MPDSDLAALCTQLSAWASANAREVGIKDHSDVVTGDFARTFFLRGGSVRSIPRPASDDEVSRSGGGGGMSPPLRKVSSDLTIAHAQRHPHREPAPGIGIGAPAPAPPPQHVAHARRHDGPDSPRGDARQDGLGLASMVRNDSLTNLAAAGSQHLRAGHFLESDGTSVESRVTPASKRDGMGLASMIRNDSLGNLQGAASRSNSRAPSVGSADDDGLEFCASPAESTLEF